MYRLLKVRSISLQNACKMPNIQDPPRMCLFCNLYHQHSTKMSNHLGLRYFSSMDTAILSSVEKRKIKRKSKKYAELLEVTDSTSSSKKALVQNLNAAQLSVLVDQPDITLDRLHKIENQTSVKLREKKCESFTTSIITSLEDQLKLNYLNSKDLESSSMELFKDILESDEKDGDIVDELQSSGVTDQTDLIKTSTLVKSIKDPLPDETLLKIPEKPKKRKKQNKEKEKITLPEDPFLVQEKLKQFNKVLLGYINVCTNSNNSQYGYRIITALRKNVKSKSYDLYVTDTGVFNAQLEKLASDSDLTSLFNLSEFMRKENIKFNHQTYAYFFYCIAKMDIKNDNEKMEYLKLVESEMIKDHISFNDIVTKSSFLHDQKLQVEKMIKLLNDKFEPEYKLPDLSYDCRLLDKFSDLDGTPSSTVDGILDMNDLTDRLQKQIQMEIDGQVTVQNIAKSTLSKDNIEFWRKKLSVVEKMWKKAAIQSFNRNFITLKKREVFLSQRKMTLHPYLSVLESEDYINILLREVKKLAMGSEMYSLPYNHLCSDIGIQVFKLYEARVKQKNGVNDKMSKVYLQYSDWFLKRDNQLNSRETWTLLEHEANKEGVTLNFEVPSWQYNVHLSIGKFLFDIMINDLKLDLNMFKKKKNVGQPQRVQAFYKVFRHSGVMLKEEVKPHPLVAKLYRNSEPETLTFDTTLVPSVCPPKPWVSVHNGGYVVSKTNVIRIPFMGNQQWDRLVQTPPKKIYPALDSLNQLGSIPWAINDSVLDVAIEVFRNDGSVELNMPQPPSVLQPVRPPSKNASLEDKKKYYDDRRENMRKKNEMYSLWCDALYRLSLANHFRNQIFWLPHNMDFRGRVYPIPPHLTHLGSDLARSMLKFGLKKPLGVDGLDWLKLHAINLTGFKKKSSISDRLKYADEIMDKILDSAEKPLTGEMWWAKSDEPWQTLAVCMEISAAVKSPNPAEFMSGFPIHQDGSCNGLQHYAALGRDKIGGESVNLCPSEVPQDVYSSVATMVDQNRKQDAANGNKIAQILEGFIHRKVIKQTIMTTVYGVTWFGAKLQIARQLKDLDNFPQEYLWPASIYLVHKTFETLRTMFKSAREIQDWLTECCRLVCASKDTNMEWITPLGLPVVQPYSKKIARNRESQALAPSFSPDIFRKPNIMKQKNAFAPNFVHSLDSSHMMLTSLNCEKVGITFVSVHDCYWTHPCTAEAMNKICREQFIALHSEPILQDLAEFLLETFAKEDRDLATNEVDPVKNLILVKLGTILKQVPKQSDLDLNLVLKSKYFFS